MCLWNLSKCKVMHIGSKNKCSFYMMKSYDKDKILLVSKTELENGRAWIISKDLKLFWHEWRERLNLEMPVHGNIYIIIYHALSWICSSCFAWNPYSKDDKEKLEKFQHNATKVSYTLKNIDYQSRCKALNWTTLEKKWTRSDLIQKF